MRSSPWYVAALAAFVLGCVSYVFATSEVVQLTVTGKAVEEARGRRSPVQLYVLDTDQGRLPILRFPVIGYASGVEDVHAAVSTGSTIRARVGTWPPAFLGGRRYILRVQ